MKPKRPTELGEHLKTLFLKGQGVVTQKAGAYNPAIERFSSGINTGTDIGVPVGTPITLPQGRWDVQESYSGARGRGYIGNPENRGYGNSALVRNVDTGEQFRFSHLLQSLVQAGQRLGGGIIGYSGATGNVTGPHVDIETGGWGNILGGIKSAVRKTIPTPKFDIKSLFNQAQKKYGSTLRGVSTNPEKLKALSKGKGQVRRITL